MKFIFPQNYSFKSKFLGIIEYNVLILNIIWCAFGLSVLLLSIFSFNHENFISIVIYISKFIFKPKSYLYCKKSRKMI